MELKAQHPLGSSVDRFLRAMHRHDAGRTLPILHASKLTTPQIAALELIVEPQTVSGIAAYLGLSRPATSQLIDKLVRAGFARRVEGVTDRRERNVILSAKGRTLVGRIAAARAARFDASLALLAPALAARLEAILNQVIAALGEPAARTGVRPSPARSRSR
jgi:DNA-binding MarR family transcriptional regulator